jgi:entericidin B
MKKQILSVVLAAVIIVSISACNTLRGAGTDIERGGEAIQKSTQ